MKNILIIFLLALPTIAFSQTQSELNAAAADSYTKVDKELNTVYMKVLKMHAKETLFIKALKDAQKAWIVFRDAEMIAQFPEKEKTQNYGSGYPMDMYGSLERLTKQRVKELKEYLSTN